MTSSPGPVAHSDCLLHICAQYLCENFHQQWPVLKDVVILLPSAIHAKSLRCALLQTMPTPALIPPHITTFHNLFQERTQESFVSKQRCLLILGAALNENKDLLPSTNYWQLADDLLNFFNDLDEHNCFEKNKKNLATESEYIAKIYTLWNQVKPPRNEYDLYRQSLSHDKLLREGEFVILCGFDQLAPSEAQWVQQLEKSGRLRQINHPPQCTQTALDDASITAKDRVLNAAWDPTPNAITQLVKACKKAIPQSPLTDRVHLFAPQNLEEHVRGIHTQILRWHQEGIQQIALVTHDRQLLRRLRAVLAEDRIPINDYSGWALSTTMHATTIEQLVTAAQQADTPISLLEYLLMHQLSLNFDKTNPQKALRVIHRTLAKTDHIVTTLAELVEILGQDPKKNTLIQLIRKIESALQALNQIPKQKHHAFDTLFDALHKTLQAFKLDTQFNDDAAGQQILDCLQTMQIQARQENLQGDLETWRSWIFYTLEITNFFPRQTQAGVQFYNLNQSLLLCSEAVILASLDQSNHTPVNAQILNDDSRSQLGLQTHQAFVQLTDSRFHRLIRTSTHVLLSYQASNEGKTQMPLPWIDELEHFHQLSYQQSLSVEHPEQMVASLPETSIELDPKNLTRPAPTAPSALFPPSLSAQSYSCAVCCPYRFFVQYNLGVRQLETGKAHESPKDYGKKLHQCIEALHQDVQGLPGPVKQWDPGKMDSILALGLAIIDALYPQSMRTHYGVVAQINKMQQALKRYLAWFLETGWTTPVELQSEVEYEKNLDEAIRIYGRLDQLITLSNGEKHIVDYKSGRAPTGKDIESGLDNQIGFYTLLEPSATHAHYVQVSNQNKNKTTSVASEALNELRKKSQQRLCDFSNDFYAGLSLPAWASAKDCDHCPYPGVCRKPIWEKSERHKLKSDSGKIQN